MVLVSPDKTLWATRDKITVRGDAEVVTSRLDCVDWLGLCVGEEDGEGEEEEEELEYWNGWPLEVSWESHSCLISCVTVVMSEVT